MNWTVAIVDEYGRKEISNVVEITLSSTQLSGLKLMKYLDPYGDTIFNTLQMTDLIHDLRVLANTEKSQSIFSVMDLAYRVQVEVHQYLVFYGD